MREIKFRGMRLTGSYWEFGSLYINERLETFIDKYDWKREPVIPESVGEFTGLKDKNGKEIYEDDYYQVPNGEICIIKYQGNKFVAIPLKPKYPMIPQYDHFGSPEGEGLVLGNKFQNPEILKEVDKDGERGS